MTMGRVARLGLLVFLVAILQVAAISGVEALGATPDSLLVVLVAVALREGSIGGAVAGFAAGLIVDTVTLGTLGVSSLLFAVAAYWVGRYGETTGRGRAHALALAVAVTTALVGLCAYALHYMLGEEVNAANALTPIVPAIALNLILAYPLSRVVSWSLGQLEHEERGTEVEVLA